MITSIKKVKNVYKVEEFIYEEKRIKKYKLNYQNLIQKLNEYDFSNSECKVNLLLEKYAYKNKKDEEIFNSGIITGTFFICLTIILLYICPILILPLFVFALYTIKYVAIKLNKTFKENDIYDKFILYYENRNVCKNIKGNTFDGTIFSLYFNSEKEIKSVIEKNKNDKKNLSFTKIDFEKVEKAKKLVHKRNVK